MLLLFICLFIWIAIGLLLFSVREEEKRFNIRLNLTILRAVVIQPVVQVRYGLDRHIQQV